MSDMMKKRKFDPFYSDENQQRLRKSIEQLEQSRVVKADLIEPLDDEEIPTE